jgi:hypothetical protein
LEWQSKELPHFEASSRNEKNQKRTAGSNNGVVTSQGTVGIAVPRTKPSRSHILRIQQGRKTCGAQTRSSGIWNNSVDNSDMPQDWLKERKKADRDGEETKSTSTGTATVGLLFVVEIVEVVV